MPKMEEWIEAFRNDCREHKVQAALAYGGLAALGGIAWAAYHDRRERAHNAEIHEAYRELYDARTADGEPADTADADHRPGTYDMTAYEPLVATIPSRRFADDR